MRRFTPIEQASNPAHQNRPSENNVERFAFDGRSRSSSTSPGEQERSTVKGNQHLIHACCIPLYPGIYGGKIADSRDLAHASVMKMFGYHSVSAWLTAQHTRFHRTRRDIILYFRQSPSKCLNMHFVATHQTDMAKQKHSQMTRE